MPMIVDNFPGIAMLFQHSVRIGMGQGAMAGMRGRSGARATVHSPRHML